MILLTTIWFLHLIGITWAVFRINHGWDETALLIWFFQFLAFMLIYLRKQISALALNRHPITGVRYRTLGSGTLVTIIRGYLLVILIGFVIHARFPMTGEDWVAWIPGILFLIASAADYLDGYLARRTGHISEMGERLENLLDSAALIIAPLLAVILDRLPLWYLTILLFQAASHGAASFRIRTGRKVYPVPPRPRARVVAGFQMGFVGAALLPILPSFAVEAASVAVVAVASWEFILDILYAAGKKLKVPQPDSESFAGLRLAVRVLAFSALSINLAYLNTSFTVWLLPIGLLVPLGVAPRLAAVIVAIVCSMVGTATPITALSILLFSLVFMLGPGNRVLWDGEEKLLLQKIGGR